MTLCQSVHTSGVIQSAEDPPKSLPIDRYPGTISVLVAVLFALGFAAGCFILRAVAH